MINYSAIVEKICREEKKEVTSLVRAIIGYKVFYVKCSVYANFTSSANTKATWLMSFGFCRKSVVKIRGFSNVFFKPSNFLQSKSNIENLNMKIIGNPVFAGTGWRWERMCLW